LSLSKFSVDNETSDEFENVEEDTEIDGGYKLDLPLQLFD